MRRHTWHRRAWGPFRSSPGPGARAQPLTIRLAASACRHRQSAWHLSNLAPGHSTSATSDRWPLPSGIRRSSLTTFPLQHHFPPGLQLPPIVHSFHRHHWPIAARHKRPGRNRFNAAHHSPAPPPPARLPAAIQIRWHQFHRHRRPPAQHIAAPDHFQPTTTGRAPGRRRAHFAGYATPGRRTGSSRHANYNYRRSNRQTGHSPLPGPPDYAAFNSSFAAVIRICRST